MNKILLSLIFIVISFVGLAQESDSSKSVVPKTALQLKRINEINKFVNPKYSLLDSFYDETLINGLDLIIAVVSDTSERVGKDVPFNKIFVFKIKNSQLEMLDTSAEYEKYNFGPTISVDSDSLVVSDNVHRGSNSLTYKWDSTTNEYLLSKMEYESFGSVRRRGVDYMYNSDVIYDVKKQISIEDDYEEPEDYEGVAIHSKNKSHSKIKITHKKLPSTISLKLRDMEDPSNYDVYNKLYNP